MERILKNIEAKENPKKRMSIREIKDDAENMANCEDMINKLELSLVKYRSNKQFFDKVIKLKILLGELREKSMIMEHIGSFAYYLAVMKVTTLNKDFKTTKRIMSKFLKNKDTQLSSLITHMHSFSSKIDDLHTDFGTFIDNISQIHSLEQKIDNDFEIEKKELNNLKEISLKQKELMYNIGMTFSDIMRELMKNKDFQKCLS